MTIRFHVLGEPVAQGSMVPFQVPGMKVPSMHASNAGPLNRWRKAVAVAATNAARGQVAGKDMPVRMQLTFRFTPPKNMPKGRIAMTVAPDTDKLTRACLDAMTIKEWPRLGKLGLYADDKQVNDVHAVKVYATPNYPAGAYVQVEFAEAML